MSYHFGCNGRNFLIYILPQSIFENRLLNEFDFVIFLQKYNPEKLHHEDLHTLLILELI